MRRHRRGGALIYSAIAITALSAVASLSVDLGRVQVAKGELQSTADAAARAAAAALGSGSSAAVVAAQSVAAQQKVDGGSFSLASGDVEFGTWNASTRTFTVLSSQQSSSANAIRVTARRTATQNGGIPLMLGSIFGVRTCNASASSVAVAATPGSGGVGVVGLNWVHIEGSGYVDSYNVRASQYTTSDRRSYGNVQGNRDWYTPGGYVYGDVSYYGAYAPSISASGKITEVKQMYDDSASVVPAGVQTIASINASGTQSIQLSGGSYRVGSIVLNGSAKLQTSGTTTLYVDDKVDIWDSAEIASTHYDPKKLRIVMLKDTGDPCEMSMNINHTARIYAKVEAKRSRINVTGNGQLFGTAVAGKIWLDTNGAIHVDESITGGASSGASGILTVN